MAVGAPRLAWDCEEFERIHPGSPKGGYRDPMDATNRFSKDSRSGQRHGRTEL